MPLAAIHLESHDISTINNRSSLFAVWVVLLDCHSIMFLAPSFFLFVREERERAIVCLEPLWGLKGKEKALGGTRARGGARGRVRVADKLLSGSHKGIACAQALLCHGPTPRANCYSARLSQHPGTRHYRQVPWQCEELAEQLGKSPRLDLSQHTSAGLKEPNQDSNNESFTWLQISTTLKRLLEL